MGLYCRARGPSRSRTPASAAASCFKGSRSAAGRPPAMERMSGSTATASSSRMTERFRWTTSALGASSSSLMPTSREGAGNWRLESQPLLEPVQDQPQPFHAPIGGTGARQFVVLIGKAGQLDRPPQSLQVDEELLSLLDRAAQVLLAVGQQQRGVHLVHVGERALLDVLPPVVPRLLPHVVGGEEIADVAGAEETHPVGDASLADPCSEAVGVPHDPIGHETAVGAAAASQSPP